MNCKSHPNKLLNQHIKEIDNIFYKLINFYDIKLNKDEKLLFNYLIKLHDIGKCRKDFQKYIEKLEKGEKLKSPGSHSLWSLEELEKILHKINLNKEYLPLLFYFIAKHHSNLNLNFEHGKQIGKLIIKYYYGIGDYKDDKDISKFIKINKDKHSKEDLYKIYLILNNLDKGELRNFYLNHFKKFKKEELIKLADLYGIFKISDILSAKNALKKVEDICYREKITETKVKNIINKDIDQDRWNIQKNLSKYDYLFLRAPTGWGKTTTALLFSLNKEYNKIFITLPTITAIEDFRQKLNNAGFKAEEYFYFYDAKLILDEEDERLSNLYLTQNLYSPINITTIDQILLSFLQAGKYFMKRLNLRKSILILDEIHLLTPQMLFLLKKFLEHLVPLYHIKILLMSATLPKGIVDYLLEDINIDFKFIDIYEIDSKYKERERVKIQLFEKDILDNLENIIEENRTGKSVLVIVNTVEKAVCIYKKLKEEYNIDNILLLHGRFMFKHRKDKEKNIKNILKNKGILVSTQITEVSLDVDFDVLFTEAAPISAIVQRMGRVNRYGKKPKSDIYIYYPKEIKDIKDDRRKKYPYNIEEIEKTWKFLKELDIFKEGIFTQTIDNTFTKEFYEELIKKDKIFKKYEDVFENNKSSSNVYWFLQSTSEEEGRKLLDFRENITTLIIPYGDLVEIKIHEEIRKLINMYNKLKNINASYEQWRRFFAKAKTYAIPTPIYLVLNLESNKVGIPIINKFKENYEFKYFKEYGFVNLKKLESLGCKLEDNDTLLFI